MQCHIGVPKNGATKRCHIPVSQNTVNVFFHPVANVLRPVSVNNFRPLNVLFSSDRRMSYKFSDKVN